MCVLCQIRCCFPQLLQVKGQASPLSSIVRLLKQRGHRGGYKQLMKLLHGWARRHMEVYVVTKIFQNIRRLPTLEKFGYNH